MNLLAILTKYHRVAAHNQTDKQFATFSNEVYVTTARSIPECTASVTIIIIVFSLIALPDENKVHFRRAKRASYIQYGCRKCGTRAKVFSRTLAHGDSNIEIRKRNTERGQTE